MQSALPNASCLCTLRIAREYSNAAPYYFCLYFFSVIPVLQINHIVSHCCVCMPQLCNKGKVAYLFTEAKSYHFRELDNIPLAYCNLR